MQGTSGSTLKFTDSTFDQDVLSSDVPVLVDFYADWCGPCVALSPVLDELAAEYEGRVRVGKVDVEANPEVANRYEVRSIPTLLFVKNGEVVERVTGAAPKPALAQKLDALLG